MKDTASKKIGEFTGKFFAGSKALPGKTSEIAKSIKEEFIAGFESTSGSNKKMGNEVSDSVIEADDIF